MSARSVRAFVHRNYDAFVVCKKVFKTEDRAPFAFNVARGGHRNIRMPQHRVSAKRPYRALIWEPNSLRNA
jgi:hypothetical protein